MFVESLLGDITKLRKPIIQDTKFWGIGSELSTGREVAFVPTTEHEDKLNECKNNPQTIYWTIDNKENGQYIGAISVHAHSSKQSEIHISLSNPNYKGKEITTEVITLILNYLKHKAKMREAIIRVESKNEIMIKVLESLNFVIKSKSTEFTTMITQI